LIVFEQFSGSLTLRLLAAHAPVTAIGRQLPVTHPPEIFDLSRFTGRNTPPMAGALRYSLKR
jgi:hypothetical protein